MKNLTVDQRRLLKSYFEDEALGDLIEYATTREDHDGRRTTVKDAAYDSKRDAAVAMVEDIIERLS